MIGSSRPTELSPNIFKRPQDITHNNKQIMKPPWNCFKSSIRTLKHSTGTMGSTLHLVSKSAWGEGVLEGNIYLAFAYFPFHHLALHAKKKRKSSQLSLFSFKCHLLCFLMSGKNAYVLQLKWWTVALFNFFVMHSLQLIFSKNWVRWSQKVYPEPEILWVASAWSESKLLRSMIWCIRAATNLFWAKFLRPELLSLKTIK